MFYVGMTRAKERLHIYYVKERYHKQMEPSRFLEEAGMIPAQKQIEKEEDYRSSSPTNSSYS